MWSLKNDNASQSDSQMPYAIYFNNGALNIYETRSQRGLVGSYVAGVTYEVRIDDGGWRGLLYPRGGRS